MRGLRVWLAAGAAVTAIVVSGCGVAAPKNVASVDGVGVSLDDVDRVARDPLFDLVSSSAPDSKLPGDAARSALMFEVTRAAWISEARRWGLDPDSARDAAEKDLDQQIAGSAEPVKLSKEMRQAYIDSTAARLVLQDRFAKLDPNSDKDLRRIFDLSPSLWERTCAWILMVPDGADGKVQALADKDVAFDKIAERVKGANVVAQPDQGCLSTTSIPFELREGINGLALNKAKIFDLEFGGSPAKYLIKVSSRKHLTFGEAKDDLAQIISALQRGGPQPWIATRVAEAEVDPRFASAVSLDAQGQPSFVPPLGPLQPKVKTPTQSDADRIGS